MRTRTRNKGCHLPNRSRADSCSSPSRLQWPA
jgi:hypothetical protein